MRNSGMNAPAAETRKKCQFVSNVRASFARVSERYGSYSGLAEAEGEGATEEGGSWVSICSCVCIRRRRACPGGNLIASDNAP